ncbi:MAG TPA: 1,4-alpha-glucan branching protein domain-containing protein [Bacillota bacterium]|nr:1,4-alpha-glucan branching protein domain-containing protein [Bacillota bacterium]
MSLGYLSLVLHAHLPFVRHPEDPHALEQRWLYEAITETYIPLLNVFQTLAKEGIKYRITFSVSPPLICMLADPQLQKGYLKHLENLRRLIYCELERTYSQPEFHKLAQLYQYRINQCYHIFHEENRDNLLNAFRKLEEQGYLEIITSSATHGYFPLYSSYREGIRAQVEVAVDTFHRHFGHTPKGFWLPECAYYPGADAILQEYGIEYFFVDTHGVLFAEHRPRYGVYAPLLCPSGVAAFGRDAESSKQVWSADEGYPGDPDYREYYRDIGYDLDYDYIKPFIHPEGFRINTGIKYYRITGKTNDKHPYVPEWATDKAAIHAGNFMFNREKQVEHLAGIMDRKPIIVAPYDTELFGHWWFEGPMFLDFLIRKMYYDQSVVQLITPGDYLREYPQNQVSIPCSSSWGQGGYHEFWLDGSNAWIYRHLHDKVEKMVSLANRYPQADGTTRRLLNQAARELLLAQSSDWAFIMKTGTMVDYAVRRTRQHLENFDKLFGSLEADSVSGDEEWLSRLEDKNNIFPELDYRIYASK